MSRLGRPETGAVRRRDGRRRCDPSIPAYLVRPVSIYGSDAEVKIVDFGNGMYVQYCLKLEQVYRLNIYI